MPPRRPGRSGKVIACAGWLLAATAGAAGASVLPKAPGAVDTGGHRPTPIAVFGDDDRELLAPPRQKLARSVGLLFSRMTRSICSAFCVGDDIVATASHCMFSHGGTSSRLLASFQFAHALRRGQETARILGADQGLAPNHIAAGSHGVRTSPPIEAMRDWALIRLDRPICRNAALKVDAMSTGELVAASREQRLYQIAFHRDFGDWRPVYSKPCGVLAPTARAGGSDLRADFTDSEHLVLHTCDTGEASSGSPLIVDGPGGPTVVAINVGTYVYTRSTARNAARGGASQRTAHPIANTAIATAAFAPALGRLSGARILTSPQELSALQRALQRLGHYSGRIDGRYGALLAAAIRAYEHSRGAPRTSLATADLLAEIVAGLAAKGDRQGAHNVALLSNGAAAVGGLNPGRALPRHRHRPRR